jgi:hypothetical protein
MAHWGVPVVNPDRRRRRDAAAEHPSPRASKPGARAPIGLRAESEGPPGIHHPTRKQRVQTDIGETDRVDLNHAAARSKPRLQRMVKRHRVAVVCRALRVLARFLAAFMVFAQVAAAGAICPDLAAGRRGAMDSCAHAGRAHDAGSDVCASAFVPAFQLPAFDPVARVPDLGPAVDLAGLWPQAASAPLLRAPGATRDAEPPAPVPRFLRLRRLPR